MAKVFIVCYTYKNKKAKQKKPKNGQGKRKLGRTVSQGQGWMDLVTLHVPPSYNALKMVRTTISTIKWVK